MEIPIVGGAYLGRSKNLNSQLCQNLYPVLDQHGKKVAALHHTPGMVEWYDFGEEVEIRGMGQIGTDQFVVVAGDTAYALNGSTPTVNTYTGVTNLGSTSRVYIAYNEDYVVIMASGRGYYAHQISATYPDYELIQITDVDFPSQITSLTYQDTFFVVTEYDTGRIYISASGDPTSWSGLDYATAEGFPDTAIAVVSLLRELWILGQVTCEIFYNSGDADFPFERIPGSFNEIGIGSRDSLGKADNHIFFLGHDWSVYMSEGLQLRKISTPQIDYHISEHPGKEFAKGYAYTHEGVTFYVLTFDSYTLKTFVYDTSSGLWHTRASGVNEIAHRGRCALGFDGKMLVGDYTNGKIYYYDYDTYTEDGEMLIRRRRAKAVDAGRKLIFHHILEVEFEAGVGLNTGQGDDPQIMLRWSDDGGHQWSHEHWTTMGAIGKYNNRSRWKKLGRSRERIYEIAISDPVKVVIISAYIEATAGTT